MANDHHSTHRGGDDNAIYQAARRLVGLKISCIPTRTGTKAPPLGFRWGEYAHRLPDASELWEWFVGSGHQLAVLPGIISGWLSIVDFDGVGGFVFAAEQSEYGELHWGRAST